MKTNELHLILKKSCVILVDSDDESSITYILPHLINAYLAHLKITDFNQNNLHNLIEEI